MAWCSPLNPSQRHYVSALLCCLDFRPELPGLDFDFDSCPTSKQGDGHNCSDDSDTGLQPEYRALSLILISGSGCIHKCKIGPVLSSLIPTSRLLTCPLLRRTTSITSRPLGLSRDRPSSRRRSRSATTSSSASRRLSGSSVKWFCTEPPQASFTHASWRDAAKLGFDEGVAGHITVRVSHPCHILICRRC